MLFSATACCSAFLLFWCQPLIAKALLPLLGGAPAVWNTTMMFFQAILLAGYLYAHGIARVARAQQAIIHGAVLLAALWFLPFGNTAHLSTPAQGSPIAWLVATLAGSVGLPFFALSGSAPLLQTWYENRRAPGAGDPYFLYAGSNAGSLMALIAFPFLLEPALSVDAQRRLWAAAFLLVGGLLAACLAAGGRQAPTAPAAASRPSWAERGVWLFLGFVPSSLLLGVTAYVATDIASVPLLWVLPLALYLITFIIAFSRWVAPPVFLRAALTLSLSLLGALLFHARLSGGAHLPATLVIAAHFGAFFLVALVCHSVVAARRPPAARLTEFYVFLSAGGALGGIFNALLAPILFNWTYEYEVVVAAACLVRFFLGATSTPRPLCLVIPLMVLLFIEIAPRILNAAGADLRSLCILGLVLGGATTLLVTSRRWPALFTATMACLLAGGTMITGSGTLRTERSFFGVHRVVSLENGALTGLMHGNILHGAEYNAPARWKQQTGYYTQDGPIGQIMAARSQARRVGIVGLGTGSLACYARPGQDWTFYEIDPAIAKLAGNTEYFHYLQICGPSMRIVTGDGRLALRNDTTARYDLLVIDAFSSDSIPLHLLTREAFGIYAARLSSTGWLVLHVSNRYLRLAPTVAVTSAAAGFSGFDQIYVPPSADASSHTLPSEWIALAQNETLLRTLGTDRRWTALPQRNFTPVWTDSYSDILAVLR